MPTYLTPGVYVEEVPSGSMPLSAASTAVAAFIGYTEKSPTDDPLDPDGVRPRPVTNWTQFKKLYGGFTSTALLPQAVYGFFQNGGGRCYIVRIPNRTVPRGELPPTADGQKVLDFVSLADSTAVTVKVAPTPPKSDPATNGDGAAGDTKAKAKEKDAEKDAAKDAEKDAATDAAATPSRAAKPTFDVTVLVGDEVKETFSELSLGKGASNVATMINGESKWIEVFSHVDDVDLAVEAGNIELAASEVKSVEIDTFKGDATTRAGVEGLVIADDVTMVMVPDLYTAAKLDEAPGYNAKMWKGVHDAVVSHCTRAGNRMAILDPPPNLNADGVQRWHASLGIDSKYAALYYPWLEVDDPAGKNGKKTIHVPPCGHMAGIWARTDATRGVWKAPANESVLGAIDVQERITKDEQGALNPLGINAIRSFGSRGLKVWGARTMSLTDSSWRYINVRRLFNMIETTIMDGTQWVVFEPNDQALWQRVNRTVSSFLLGLWREGALFGATPDEAFFVKCDRETNPPESIDEGKLIVEVGVAPVKPAEFVIFRISQKSLAATT